MDTNETPTEQSIVVKNEEILESNTADPANDDNPEENATKLSSEVKLEVDTAKPNDVPAKSRKSLPKLPFKCDECNFNLYYNYKGIKPSFSKNIQFNEECYIAQDPFSPPPTNLSNKSNSEYFIVIGCDCCNCGKVVCSSTDCSIFYRKFYCRQCAFQLLYQFPVEIQSKIRKYFVKV